MSSRILKILKDPRLLFLTAGHRGLLNWFNDETYLKIAFKIRMKAKLNLDEPKTFNEKLQWLKLYDRKPIYSSMVDKYEAKEYVSKMIGDSYLIPTLGVWDSIDAINFESLPDEFVLKCTHDSGGLVICRNKKKLDIDVVKKRITSSMKHNFYGSLREWPYKNVTPRIIAEKYMKNGNDENLNVFKIFCFSGEPTLIQVIQNDKTDYESIDYFDTEWNLLELRQNFPNSQNPLKRPQTLEKMLCLAKQLSTGIPFVRTDFYEINGAVFFSEFTFYSDGGMAKFEPEIWDRTLGEKIVLPNCI